MVAFHEMPKGENPRERLGRALWKARGPVSWDCAADDVKDLYCNQAQAVLDEQRKIQEEGDDGK